MEELENVRRIIRLAQADARTGEVKGIGANPGQGRLDRAVGKEGGQKARRQRCQTGRVGKVRPAESRQGLRHVEARIRGSRHISFHRLHAKPGRVDGRVIGVGVAIGGAEGLRHCPFDGRQLVLEGPSEH